MGFSTVSFRPPTPIGPYAAGSTSTRSGCPDWVLLNKSARFSDLQNATTAECHTTKDQAVEVSFWLVDPPGVSYFSIYCPGLTEDEFRHEPLVICAEAALVLLRITTNVPRRNSSYSTHHLVYRAGPGKPSLHLLPNYDVEAFGAQLLGLLPCGDADSEHYAVAFLHRKWITRDETWRFDVHVFSSETQSWSSKVALLGVLESDMDLLGGHAPCKQIKVGASSLGWVDLRRGILLLCNPLAKFPIIKFIPFPASRVCIRDKEDLPYYASEHFCDVAGCEDDLIKFVEIDFDDPACRRNDQGWKAITWIRKIGWNNWHKRFTVDVATISVDQSYLGLLPELWDNKTQRPQLKKLILYTPTLSMHNDDSLYLMSLVNDQHEKAWLIAVDMKHAAVEAIAPVFIEPRYLIAMHCLCAFPKYLNMTPGANKANPVDTYFKTISMVHCTRQLLWTRDQFRKIAQCLEFEGSAYNACIPLLSDCSVSSLCFNIRAMAEHASYNVQGEAASKAVEFCLRALEDFDLLRGKALRDASTSMKAMKRKTSVALRALDSILQILPPAPAPGERAHPDACNKRRGKAIFEPCVKPDDDTKENLLHGVPSTKKQGHTKHKYFPWLQGRYHPNIARGNEQTTGLES